MGADAATTPIKRIMRDPAVLAGKPVIKGTRIPVEVVLEYLAHNPDFSELFADYPRLTMDDVKACFAYARSLVDSPEFSTGRASRIGWRNPPGSSRLPGAKDTGLGDEAG